MRVHTMAVRPGGKLDVYRNLRAECGVSPRLREVDPWRYCTRCGCSERAIKAFRWLCQSDRELEQLGQLNILDGAA